VLTIHCKPVCTICCNLAVLAVCFVASVPQPAPGSFIVLQVDHHPPRRSPAIFVVPPHVFVIKWHHPWGRIPRGLNYKGKMHRQHIKQFNIHTQLFLLVRRAFFLTTSVFRTPATPKHTVRRNIVGGEKSLRDFVTQ
jgi:hypothetical protein